MQKSKLSKRRENKKVKKVNSLGLFSVFILILFFLLIFFVIWKVIDIEKFIYVNKTNDGSAEIVIVDTDLDKLIKYLIPADTELDSSRGYGKYKVSSLWSLSEKDNNGKLMSETIAKNFYLPVYLWKNGKDSNLNLYQWIRVLFLKKGSYEYQLVFDTTKLPSSVLINFVNANFSDSNPKVNVEDLTGSQTTIGMISKIVEVVGGKITSNSKGYNVDLDCEIYGKEPKFVHIFSAIFSCEEKIDNTLTTDLKIRLGAKFIDRF